MPSASASSEQSASKEPPMPDRELRVSGMRDLGPEEMDGFRRVERAFLEVCARHGYREIRTPTLEPLHLFTATGALSPQLLDRVYSFLDWDGWSGERVVLRPDATVPAARWFEEHGGGNGTARLCYVQPVFRFEAGGADRELWQCGVELFGLAAPGADAELLLLARELLTELGLGELRYEIAHAGLVRAVLATVGLDAAERLTAYDRLLDGDPGAAEELAGQRSESAALLRLLFGVEGHTAGYLANLRATLLPVAPDAEGPLRELEEAAKALESERCAYTLRPVAARSFEYYSGVTFVLSSGGEDCVAGGRYDGLGRELGGSDVPASGFGADILRLAELSSRAAR